MAPRNSNKKRTKPIRTQILDAALHLYSSKGYFNASIHDIQREADVSMGSIYNHFSGKEAIAKALYDDLLGEMEALVDDSIADHDTAASRCRATIKALFEHTESEPEKTGFILNARHREFLTDEAPICSSQAFVKMRDIVHAGVRSGEVRDMQPWTAASMAFGPALRMIVLRLDGMIEHPLPESLDEVWSLTWDAIKAR